MYKTSKFTPGACIDIALGPVHHIADTDEAPPPPVKRPIPRSGPQPEARSNKRQPCRTAVQSEPEEIFNLDVSGSEDSTTSAVNQTRMRSSPARQRQRPPLPPSGPTLPQPGPVVRESGRPQTDPPTTNSGSGLGIVCDDDCDCSLFTGSELDRDAEEGDKKILVSDLKHFFRRAADGTWTCKKCA